MKTNTTKIVRMQMLSMAGAVYLINALIMFGISGMVEYKELYHQADMSGVFTLGLVFALFALYGYMHAHNRTVLQLLTFAYMLPLTGMSMITMAVLYFIQRPMSSSYGIWVLMTMAAILLALSFAVSWKASEQAQRMNFK